MNIKIALDSRKDIFDRSIFAQALSAEQETVYEIEQILSGLETEIKKVHRKIIFMRIAFYIFLMVLIGGLIYIGGWGDISAGKAVLLCFCGAAFIIGSFYRVTAKATRLEKDLRKFAEDFIQKPNTNFTKTGLRWSVPMNFPNSMDLYVNLSVIRVRNRRQNNENANGNRQPLSEENVQIVVENSNDAPYQPPAMYE